MSSEPCLFLITNLQSDHHVALCWLVECTMSRVSFSWILNQLNTESVEYWISWILNQTLLFVHSNSNDSNLPPSVAANISVSSSVNVACYFFECLVQIKLLFAAPLQTFGLWWKHGSLFSVFFAQNIDCDVLITEVLRWWTASNCLCSSDDQTFACSVFEKQEFQHW